MYFHRFQRGTAADIGFPSLIFKLMRPRLAKALSVQGYGRHTDEESKLIFNSNYILFFFKLNLMFKQNYFSLSHWKARFNSSRKFSW
jgi:hypothetical protein